MNNCIDIRGVKIGEGIPKICVPIVGKTSGEILEAALALKEIKHDLVEWRVDFFENVLFPSAVSDILYKLRDILDDTPLLFTFRTKVEGGELEINKEDYYQINLEAIDTGLIDLVDVELFAGDDLVSSLVEAAHRNNIKVIVSNHDFERTPAKKELISRLQRMQILVLTFQRLQLCL